MSSSNNQNDLLLFTAASNGDYKQIQSILREQQGSINVNIRDGNDRHNTLLHKACQCSEKEGSYLQVVELLLAHGAQVNSKNKNCLTPLHVACQNGKNIDVVRFLIDNNAEIECKDNSCWTPLFYACWNRHLDVAQLLLERKARVNCRNSMGYAPLFYACCYGYIDVVKLLLENKADVNNAGDNSCSALIAACRLGHVEVVKLLIYANANLNIPKLGCTPLHVAAYRGDTHIVQLLLRYGADMRIKRQRDDKTAEDIARDNGMSEIVACFQNFIEMRRKAFLWFRRRRRQKRPRSW